MLSISLEDVGRWINSNRFILQVGKEKWAVGIQYDIVSKRLIKLLREQGEATEAADLEAYKADLADEGNGGNREFWQNLADQGKLAGQFQTVLTGEKRWNPQLKLFEMNNNSGSVGDT